MAARVVTATLRHAVIMKRLSQHVCTHKHSRLVCMLEVRVLDVEFTIVIDVARANVVRKV
jgi:hypothetical protein